MLTSNVKNYPSVRVISDVTFNKVVGYKMCAYVDDSYSI